MVRRRLTSPGRLHARARKRAPARGLVEPERSGKRVGRQEHAEMNIMITGNMGYVGPAVVSHLRKALPGVTITGVDSGLFAHCLTEGSLPEREVDVQVFRDVRDLDADIEFARQVTVSEKYLHVGEPRLPVAGFAVPPRCRGRDRAPFYATKQLQSQRLT
jgi:hypothetical protein